MKKENDNLKPILSFDNPEEIKKFIADNESNIYSGKNVEGQDVIVNLEKGKGMIVKTLNNKNWWEWVEYDESGLRISQGVDPSGKLKKDFEEDYELDK